MKYRIPRFRFEFRTGRRILRFGAMAVLLTTIGFHAGPAPDSGFLEHPELLQPDNSSEPFNAFWKKPGVELSNFDYVLIIQVDTTHLEKMDWWQSASLAESSTLSPDREARNLATILHEQVRERLRSKTVAPLLGDKPVGRSAQLELAIVEVVPTKVWLNAIGYVVSGALDHGSTAIEGRIRDLQTGEIIAAWKDRQYGQAALVSVADLSWYTHAERAMDYWGETVGDIFHTPPNQPHKERSPVTLRAW